MFLTVGMTLGIRVPVVGPLKDINFQKHSGAPLAVLVYIYIFTYFYMSECHLYVPVAVELCSAEWKSLLPLRATTQ